MNTPLGQALDSLVLVAAALFGLACNAGAIVECQGRSTTTSNSGAYSLTQLFSGMTTVRVTVTGPPSASDDYSIELKPGPNTVDLTFF